MNCGFISYARGLGRLDSAIFDVLDQEDHADAKYEGRAKQSDMEAVLD